LAAAGARITQARGVRKARFASRLLEATAATNVLCRGRDGALVEVEVAVSEKKTPNDVRGNVVTQTRKLDGLSYLVRRNYDQTGYLRGVRYPDGEVLGQVPGEASSGAPLGYDALGRLTTIPGILNNVTYSVLGAPLVQTNANGTTTTKTYDPNRFWLTGIQTTNLTSGLSLQNLQYGLNEAGLADSVTSDVPSESRTYGYDGLNRMTSSTNATHPTVNQEWAYDTLGRFTSNSRVGTTYPNAGQPRPHAPTQISGGSLGALTFIYDANGNMTAGNGRTMAWDANNRIREVTAGGNTTTFAYGPDGTRVKKISGSSVVKYPFGDDYEIGGNARATSPERSPCQPGSTCNRGCPTRDATWRVTPPVTPAPATPPVVRHEFVDVVGRAPAPGTSMLEISVQSGTIGLAGVDLCANARAAAQHKYDLIRLISRVQSGGPEDLKGLVPGGAGETLGNANFMLVGFGIAPKKWTVS